MVDRELPVPTPQVVVNNVRSALGAVSACVYGYPSTVMKVLGVTGTAGKTTVAHALAQALRMRRRSRSDRILGPHTTPEAPDLQKLWLRCETEVGDGPVWKSPLMGLTTGVLKYRVRSEALYEPQP